MKTLHFTRPNNLSLLHDELTAALPGLAPIRDPNGDGTPVIHVEGRDNDVWFTVPDDADESAIAAVVQAHDHTKLQPDPRRERLSRIAELLETPRSSWTAAQLRELLELTAQETLQ